MRVHHLNCMTFTLAGVPNVTHCLLVETDEGPVLRLRALAHEHDGEVGPFCAHDGRRFDEIQGGAAND
ncbi:MAG: hypothetical protein KKA73_29015 [Chloroflexi bacterium]|nr:hypothetical protein [Chloroflexota bacterium]MBU1751736.1 hypothetical protein [Chloroflexota bacterium]